MWTLKVYYTLFAMTAAHGTFKEPGLAVYHTPDFRVCQLWTQDALNIANRIGPGFITVVPCTKE